MKRHKREVEKMNIVKRLAKTAIIKTRVYFKL